MGDHLIFTGDLIAKGPQSAEVVDLARNYQASCVRGNHEDRILLRRRQLKATDVVSSSSKQGDAATDTGAVHGTLSQGDDGERALARQLSDEQAAWLETCPVILRVGPIKNLGEVVVVHAGLVPGVDLKNQDPPAVMTMRTVDLNTLFPSASSNGVPWSKVKFSLFSLYSLSPPRC
jgi:Calcineurin-like phosphoesterase